MKKCLVVVDMQNDFITGSLGTAEAENITVRVREKIEKARADGCEVVFTYDTHDDNYLETQEGKNLPVSHCIKGTWGWQIEKSLPMQNAKTFEKETFGSLGLAEYIMAGAFDEVELIGLCTDICVISNAMILKAAMPEVCISVDAACCAGVTPQSHRNALEAMKMCQIRVLE